MRLFARQQLAHLALFATLARCALACGADSDHPPPIGSPTVPTVPIVEGGGSSAGGSTGQPGTSLAGAAATIDSGGSSFGSGGSPFGSGGGSPLGNGSAGGSPFGTGGSATASDPFGIGGSTFSGFSGGF
jgi:hypothetical protein